MENAVANSDIPKNPAKRRAWILFQLRIRGLSFTDLAADEGVTRQAFGAAANGGGTSARLQEVLATAIGLTPQQLFPELHDGTGRRLLKTLPANRTTTRAAGNAKNARAI